MNKNKKGILPAETVRMVLAVIVIVLLLILAFKLYGIFTKKGDMEKAKATLGEIVDKLNSLNENRLVTNVLITSPKDWNVVVPVALNTKTASGKKLCICPSKSSIIEQSKACDADGICEELQKEIQIDAVCLPNFWNCYTFAELPKSLTLELINGAYLIHPYGLISTDSFEDIFEYKKGTGKSTIELIKELADSYSPQKSADFKKIIIPQINEFLRKEYQEEIFWTLKVTFKEGGGGILLIAAHRPGQGDVYLGENEDWLFVTQEKIEHTFENSKSQKISIIFEKGEMAFVGDR